MVRSISAPRLVKLKPEPMNATDKLRQIIAAAEKSGKVTRYSISRDAKVDYSSLCRWLDKRSRREDGEEPEIRCVMINKLAKFFCVTFTDPPANWEPGK
jgi:hypothetical protein